MYRPVIDDQIDDDDDERRILKSGEVLRVSMTMMDALNPVQRAMAAANTGKSLIGELARELYGDGLTDAERAAEAARAARLRKTQDA
jgi:hypothetical protein